MDNPNVKMQSIFAEEFDSEERKLTVDILAKTADKTYAPRRILVKFTVNWELMAKHYAQWCYDNRERRVSICDDAIIADFIEEVKAEEKT